MGLYPFGTGKRLDHELVDLAVPEFNRLDYNIHSLGPYALPKGYQPIPIHKEDPDSFMHMKLDTPEGEIFKKRNLNSALYFNIMDRFSETIQKLKGYLGNDWKSEDSDLENVYDFMDSYISDKFNGFPLPDFITRDP